MFLQIKTNILERYHPQKIYLGRRCRRCICLYTLLYTVSTASSLVSYDNNIIYIHRYYNCQLLLFFLIRFQQKIKSSTFQERIGERFRPGRIQTYRSTY